MHWALFLQLEHMFGLLIPICLSLSSMLFKLCWPQPFGCGQLNFNDLRKILRNLQMNRDIEKLSRDWNLGKELAEHSLIAYTK